MVATSQQVQYVAGRQKYARPQALIFANGYDLSDTGIMVPTGYEMQSDVISANENFLILSDHNRSPIDLSYERIESRERMVNGRMRSYHIADKKRLSLSWNALPSRSFASSPEFYTVGSEAGKSSLTGTREEYTVDGGAGGVELKNWYDDHVGSFYVLLAYDNYEDAGNTVVGSGESAYTIDKYDKLNQYTEALEMYISDFSYTVEKRGSTNHDLWSVSISLEEV